MARCYLLAPMVHLGASLYSMTVLFVFEDFVRKPRMVQALIRAVHLA